MQVSGSLSQNDEDMGSSSPTSVDSSMAESGSTNSPSYSGIPIVEDSESTSTGSKDTESHVTKSNASELNETGVVVNLPSLTHLDVQIE